MRSRCNTWATPTSAVAPRLPCRRRSTRLVQRPPWLVIHLPQSTARWSLSPPRYRRSLPAAARRPARSSSSMGRPSWTRRLWITPGLPHSPPRPWRWDRTRSRCSTSATATSPATLRPLSPRRSTRRPQRPLWPAVRLPRSSVRPLPLPPRFRLSRRRRQPNRLGRVLRRNDRAGHGDPG